MGDTIVILPTYNERGNIEGLAADILSRDSRIEILVVDDSSPDGTADIVMDRYGGDQRVHLMVRTENRGRGYAGAAGFRWAAERDYKYVIEMDADGSHDPSYIKYILSELESSDMVICSRFVPGGGEKGRGAVRRLITIAANVYLRKVLRLDVRDCTTGFRGFRNELIKNIPWNDVQSAGPAIVQEVLFIASQKGASIKEIPFIFVERKAGSSKLSFGTLIAGLTGAPNIAARHGGRYT